MQNGMELNMAEEFASLGFNSSRLERRFIKAMETPAGQPDKSIWSGSETRAEAKAIYRMPGNENLVREEILRARREAAVKRAIQLGNPVLAIQDTAGLNYNTQTKMKGAGYTGDKTQGVNIHSRLAVSTGGLALGVLPQPSYNRPQPRGNTREREGKKVLASEGKGSCRRARTHGESAAGLPGGIHIVTACVREGGMEG
jgi:hypothetical protein